jgi:hypothetical protein
MHEDRVLAQLENIEAIERRLWKAPDTPRSNSELPSNEHFLPVMGLIFLRHAYSRLPAVKDQIVAGLPSRGGQTRELRVENWREKDSTRDAVKQKIYDFLWVDSTGLPVNDYSEVEINFVAENVFRQVCRAYPTVPSPIYGH